MEQRQSFQKKKKKKVLEWCYCICLTYQKMTLDTEFMLSKINLKWTIELNWEHKTIKFLEDNRKKPR